MRRASEPTPENQQPTDPLDETTRASGARPTPIRIVAVALTLLALFCSYSTEAADTDFWWHLATGKYIASQHALPDPDPFSYTADDGEPAFLGELRVRSFNLTHEWLAQLVWYAVWTVGGFPAVVAWKALLLTFFSGVAGWLSWRRTGSAAAGILAALAGYPIVQFFAADRPALVSFALVAAFTLLLERYRERGDRSALYALPVLSLLWANCHGGFFLGWVVMGAYALAAWNDPESKRKPLWTACGAAILLSGVNPNGFNVVPVLIDYQKSYLTKTLIEWRRPGFWGPPYIFQILLYGAAAVMLWRRRQVLPADWLLLAAFGAAGLMAFRNTVFVALFAPVFLAAYGWPRLSRRYPAVDSYVGLAAAGSLAAALIVWKLYSGAMLQFRAAEWKFPVGAARFVAEKAPAAKIWNTYEYGGYLIWALGPSQKTFIDGRALNESVYRDYLRILGSRPQDRDLLDRYDPDLIITNSFEFVSGVLYPLVMRLGEPSSTTWELVYQDAQALVFARSNDANRALIEANRLDKSEVFDHLDASCRSYVEHDPTLPACARTLGLLYQRKGDREKALANLLTYRRLWPDPDPAVNRALAALNP